MDFSEIDRTYEYYEKRYNLSKMAMECGISLKEFTKFDSKQKFLILSYKLKNSNKINLASFFFGKLFEISQDFEALINKIECLISLQEYEEAIKYNNIGWELYMEDPEINSIESEKTLSYQKALISFYIERFNISESICEESIIKFKSKEFYHLLCTNFIAMDNIKNAIKFFNKYAPKYDSLISFLVEVVTMLLNINLLDKALNFIYSLYNLNDGQKKELINQINKFYAFNKNKTILNNFFEKELKTIQKQVKEFKI